MGKGTYKGLRKPDDPIYRQTTIVIGGLKKKPSSAEPSTGKKKKDS